MDINKTVSSLYEYSVYTTNLRLLLYAHDRTLTPRPVPVHR
jgi:hypothetical protein